MAAAANWANRMISIPALREEGDETICHVRDRSSISIPALREEGDPRASSS